MLYCKDCKTIHATCYYVMFGNHYTGLKIVNIHNGNIKLEPESVGMKFLKCLCDSTNVVILDSSDCRKPFFKKHILNLFTKMKEGNYVIDFSTLSAEQLLIVHKYLAGELQWVDI